MQLVLGCSSSFWFEINKRWIFKFNNQTDHQIISVWWSIAIFKTVSIWNSLTVKLNSFLLAIWHESVSQSSPKFSSTKVYLNCEQFLAMNSRSHARVPLVCSAVIFQFSFSFFKTRDAVKQYQIRRHAILYQNKEVPTVRAIYFKSLNCNWKLRKYVRHVQLLIEHCFPPLEKCCTTKGVKIQNIHVISPTHAKELQMFKYVHANELNSVN